MATKTIDFMELGQIGVVADIPPYAIAPNALSWARNIRVDNGQVSNFPGHEKICTGLLEVDSPYYIQMFQTPGTYYWVVCGRTAALETDMCISNGAAKVDVTPVAGFAVTPADQWSGGVFNGVSVLCNGLGNYPVYLTGVGTTPIYVDLPYTITPGNPPVVTSTWRDQNVLANIIRPFKNFLVAFDIIRDNERYPYMVKWSDAVDPGGIPSWDNTDPSLLANETILAETGGFVVDFSPLGNNGMIYKEDSVWSMTLVGGDQIFNIRKALSSVGALAVNCVTEFRSQHLVLTNGDVVVHNGQSVESIVEKRIKKTLFRLMDTDNYKSSFVARNDQASEIWVCIPEQGNALPNVAAVWNWLDNSWTIRDLPGNTAAIASGVDISQQTIPVSDPWGCTEDPENPGFPLDPLEDCQVPYFFPDPKPWGGDGIPYVPQAWGEYPYNPVIQTMVSVGDDGIFKLDTGVLFDGQVPTCEAERTDIPLSGNDRSCKVRRVYPLMEGGGQVEFYIGSQQAPSSPVSWEGPRYFTPGVDNFFNVRRTGKLVSWRIRSRSDVSWFLHGMRWDYTDEGRQ